LGNSPVSYSPGVGHNTTLLFENGFALFVRYVVGFGGIQCIESRRCGRRNQWKLVIPIARQRRTLDIGYCFSLRVLGVLVKKINDCNGGIHPCRHRGCINVIATTQIKISF